jgi:hypothetical protein
MSIDTTPSDHITEGSYALSLDCPECNRAQVFPIEIKARLTLTGDEGGKLRPVISSKAQDHNCSGEQVIPLFEGSGQAPFDTGADR